MGDSYGGADDGGWSLQRSPLPPPPHPASGAWWKWIIGGVAVAMVVAAGGIIALSQDDDGRPDGSTSMTRDVELGDLRPALLTELEVGEGFAMEGEVYEGRRSEPSPMTLDSVPNVRSSTDSSNWSTAPIRPTPSSKSSWARPMR